MADKKKKDKKAGKKKAGKGKTDYGEQTRKAVEERATKSYTKK
jgi:hypothetical protein